MKRNEHRNRYHDPFTRNLTAIFLAVVLLIAGCDSGAPDACTEVPVTLFVAGPPLSDIRVITFDSFGVALDANLSGTAETLSDGRCPGQTVLHSGSGQGAQLGQISLTQSHCVDPDDPSIITGGQFSYEGAGGALISGTYEGTVASQANGEPALEADVQITGGNFECSPPNPEEGRGTLSGTIGTDGNFSYSLDGWLFHHREQREE